jgi:hypothetical protein
MAKVEHVEGVRCLVTGEFPHITRIAYKLQENHLPPTTEVVGKVAAGPIAGFEPN